MEKKYIYISQVFKHKRPPITVREAASDNKIEKTEVKRKMRKRKIRVREEGGEQREGEE